ncbi:delta-sarcoglycan isoform X2 [Phymastichus coffea]|uniref:delta-sarcoglycan isoform X2 n=1 Tax=Phymastichus coffea TaxID=108790 RepID=UPI00273CF168|nr:delta-sarcoglycan isoform X2 [Phymastichus coffea]
MRIALGHTTGLHTRITRTQSNWSDDAASTPRQIRQPTTTTAAAAATTTTTTTSEFTSNNNKVGLGMAVYGWRRRCLYVLVLSLALVVILNLALTLWLLKVMEFSLEGIGSLKVIPGGVELRGQAAVLDSLVASSLKSRRGNSLSLESWSNFTASARGDNGRLLARFTLSEDKMECVSRAFKITDPNGELLFSATNERVVVGAKTLKITGVGGAVFDGSVQTPLVNSEAGRDLRLESATRSLEIRAPQRISIESSAGGIEADCLSQLRLSSRQGTVTLDARAVFLKGLLAPHETSSSSRRRMPSNRSDGIAVYQLCACGDGKLFLAPPDGVCQADKTVC